MESNIRNICILAHIDHGKTSVADGLLSSGGVINKRSAGVIRYLDDRLDEQSRGITMKSSAITMNYVIKSPHDENRMPVTLNLVDTPGHIDFSVEVTAALRLCDGALIVVDAVEGLCSQTKECMKKAYDEKLHMVLIINKIDKLITTLEQDPGDMYRTIYNIVTQCNKYMKSLYCLDSSLNDSDNYKEKVEDEDNEDDIGYFDPRKLNVIFASAIDRWGFTLNEIAKMYVKVIKDETTDSLINHLWNPDCFVSYSDKKIKNGAVKRNKANLFVQLALSLVHSVYLNVAIKPDVNTVPSVFKNLCIKDDKLQTQVTKLLSSNKSKEVVKLVLEAWNSLPDVIIKQCVHCIPSPFNLDKERVFYLTNVDRYANSKLVKSHINDTISAMRACSRDGPTVAYISKVVSIGESNGGSNDCQIIYPKPKQTPGTTEESNLVNKHEIVSKQSTTIQVAPRGIIVAFCRIFSGKVYVGQKLYLLNPKYNLEEYVLSTNKEEYVAKTDTITEVVITGVYNLCARQNYKSVQQMEAGGMCGITVKEDLPFNIGTLTSSLTTTPLREQSGLEPIICNVIRPNELQDLIQLQDTLRLLKQCDSSVWVVLTPAGEYLLFTAGDVHLDKCLHDLRTKFKCPQFYISPPTYSLRETVSDSPNLNTEDYEIIVDNCKIVLSIGVIPMPVEIVKIIEGNSNLLKSIQECYTVSLADVRNRYENSELQGSSPKMFSEKFVQDAVDFLKARLREAFLKCNEFWRTVNETNIWRVTPDCHNINLLLNRVPRYSCNIFNTLDESDERIWIHNQIIHAFNMFCNSGPLCEEPLNQTVFVISNLSLRGDLNSLVYGNIQHSLNQQLKTCFRSGFMKQGPLIMEPILTTNIATDFQYEGKIFSEVRKRFGKVAAEFDLDANAKNYVAKAFIPATESQGFANDIRKISSGGANPDLRFSHYEVVTTSVVEEDDEDDSLPNDPTRADRLITDIRIRKGLPVTSQVVMHAEKQRTLKK